MITYFRCLPVALVLVILLGGAQQASSQVLQSVNATGGTATGVGGTVSYSVGQIVYQGATGAGGNLAEGIQYANIAIILPIELVEVKALCENATPVVIWRTATERSNRIFSIERSIDGSRWVLAGQVAGAGDSRSERRYSFVDKAADAIPAGATAYYRLRQTDFSGAETVSATVVLQGCGSGSAPMLAFYPNPAAAGVYLTGGSAGQRYDVVSADGRAVAQGAVAEGRTYISMEHLAASVYWLRVLADNRQVAQFQVAKQ